MALTVNNWSVRPGFDRSGHPFWKCADLVAAWPRLCLSVRLRRWNFVRGKIN